MCLAALTRRRQSVRKWFQGRKGFGKNSAAICQGYCTSWIQRARVSSLLILGNQSYILPQANPCWFWCSFQLPASASGDYAPTRCFRCAKVRKKSRKRFKSFPKEQDPLLPGLSSNDLVKRTKGKELRGGEKSTLSGAKQCSGKNKEASLVFLAPVRRCFHVGFLCSV